MAPKSDSPDTPKNPENPDAAAAAAAIPTAAAADDELILLLIRHGETTYNAEGRIQGHRDVPLSDTGREQARRLARRLARLWSEPALAHGFALPPPAALFASDLSRADETARILREGAPLLRSIPFTTTPLLRERGYGDWQGLTLEELRSARAAQQARDEPPGGETWDAVWERMGHALAQIWALTPPSLPQESDSGASAPRIAAVVGHGGSLRMLFSRALGVGPDVAHGFRLGNTALSAVLLRGASPETAKGRVVLVNDTAHLE